VRKENQAHQIVAFTYMRLPIWNKICPQNAYETGLLC